MAFRGIQDRLSMKGKVAVVSGAGRGIGKAVALALAEVGAAVVFAEMDEQTGPATQQAIEDAGCEALWVHADVRHGDQVNRLMNAAVERFGSVDTMVNNAGGVFFSPALDISEHGFDALIRQIENLRAQNADIQNRAIAQNVLFAEGGTIQQEVFRAALAANLRGDNVLNDFGHGGIVPGPL
ncbi:MAG: SDR family NAD(P)-dependent oxidoreductase, partial [Chloroflexi bacterium]|nr:SDR family NAD(P)-dependent oxidoreductase [Chloroflexota bacterium]